MNKILTILSGILLGIFGLLAYLGPDKVRDRALDAIGAPFSDQRNVEVDNLRYRDFASTTPAVVTYMRVLEITGATNQDYWNNDTDASALCQLDKVSFNGRAATSTFWHQIATTTVAGFANNYIFDEDGDSNYGTSSAAFPSTAGWHMLMATGTKLHISTATSTLPFWVEAGENIAVGMFADHACDSGGVNTANGIACETATSTNTGVKPIRYEFTCSATTSPAAIRRDR